MQKNVLLVFLLLISLLERPVPLRAQAAVAPQPADEAAKDSRSQEKQPPREYLQRTAEDFVPMTRSERFAYALNRTFSPSVLLGTTVRAGLNESRDAPKEWGQGMEGFGKRWGSVYAQHFIGVALENSAAFALHEDNRYFASGKQRVWARLLYAGESTVLARHDDGSRSLSVSALGGTAGAAFLSRTWHPPSTSSMNDAAISFGLTLAVHTAMNVAREFSPSILRRVR
jgi:hypothetical protein